MQIKQDKKEIANKFLLLSRKQEIGREDILAGGFCSTKKLRCLLGAENENLKSGGGGGAKDGLGV